MSNKSQHVSIEETAFDNIIGEIGVAIRYFRKKDYFEDHLRVYMPGYFIEMLITYASKYQFVTRVEPLKIQGVEIVKGYENKIIVANSNAYRFPDRMEYKEISIPFSL